MTRATFILATLLAAVSMGAAADQTMGGADQDTRQTKTFTEIDTNSDGVLDEEEVSQADVSAEFSDIDADGDGEVNRNEYYQYHRQQSGS